MKEQIRTNLDNAKELEVLYRKDKRAFKNAFNELLPEVEATDTMEFWGLRLNHHEPADYRKDLVFVIIASVLAGILAKLPSILGLNFEEYYVRYTGFIVFPLLIIYYLLRNQVSARIMGYMAVSLIATWLYVILLPGSIKDDTILLTGIHMPLFLWGLLGIAFMGGATKTLPPRVDYIRWNGSLLVAIGLLLIAGTVLTILTVALFSVIDLDITDFYLEYIVVWGLAASPLVGNYILITNPGLIDKITSAIARIFSPIVLITLLVYLIALFWADSNPFSDRPSLITFNFLLISVMALILFSTMELSASTGHKLEVYILIALAVVTIVVNGIAISAVSYRLITMGITPNRIAVLGGNLLILLNLVIVTSNLLTRYQHNGMGKVSLSIAKFLPIYWLWAAIVTFVFPFLFNFK